MYTYPYQSMWLLMNKQRSVSACDHACVFDYKTSTDRRRRPSPYCSERAAIYPSILTRYLYNSMSCRHIPMYLFSDKGMIYFFIFSFDLVPFYSISCWHGRKTIFHLIYHNAAIPMAYHTLLSPWSYHHLAERRHILKCYDSYPSPYIITLSIYLSHSTMAPPLFFFYHQILLSPVKGRRRALSVTLSSGTSSYCDTRHTLFPISQSYLIYAINK